MCSLIVCRALPLTVTAAVVVAVVDLGAEVVVAVFGHGRLRHPDHRLQRLLGHRRHHLPLPRAKESKQRVSGELQVFDRSRSVASWFWV